MKYVKLFEQFAKSNVTESNDFEVEMAQKQLDRISHEAEELKKKIGTKEADLPAWIQDHLSNALNYIQQANTGFYLSEKKLVVGDTYVWVGKEWDPKQKDNVAADKKVTITKIEGSKVFGKFDGESKEYIIRDADKFLKPIKEAKVNESVEIKVSLKHAKEAGDLFDDMFKRYGKKSATDVFDFKDKHAAHDFVYTLIKQMHIAPAEIEAPEEMFEAIVTEKEFSEEEREALAKKGIALPDGSFPIENVEDLKNAIHAYGRAKDQKAAAKHIAKRAKALGKSDLIPQTKDFQDSLK